VSDRIRCQIVAFDMSATGAHMDTTDVVDKSIAGWRIHTYIHACIHSIQVCMYRFLVKNTFVHSYSSIKAYYSSIGKKKYGNNPFLLI
jgi:hypothetical protein